MKEISIAFGEGNGLIGTICLPDGDADAGSRVGIVLFNAGVVHRVGPHRINVRLARLLARRGIPSIRFDLSGLGDSARPKGGVDFEAQAVADLRSAMDVFARHTGVAKFGIFGFCSGAYHGFAATQADTRVVGLLMFDGYRYPTLRGHLNRYLMRIRQLGFLTAVSGWAVRAFAFLGRRMALIKRRSEDGQRLSDVSFIVNSATKEEFAAGLKVLITRKVRVGLVYAGDSFDYYNYGAQFNDAFRPLGVADSVTSEFLRDADHVLTGTDDQLDLIRAVERWALDLDVGPTRA